MGIIKYLQSRNRHADLENRGVDTRRGGEGKVRQVEREALPYIYYPV